MELNPKFPFTIQRNVRAPKVASLSHNKALRKKVKTETTPQHINNSNTNAMINGMINSTQVSIPNFKVSDCPELIPEKYFYQKQLIIQEDEEGHACFFINTGIEGNVNWPQRVYGNEIRLPITNQSFDTQSSLSCESYEKLMKITLAQEINKFCSNAQEKMFENWNEAASLIESDDQSYYDLMNLEGVCGKEIKKFPIPFDKEIINYIENEDC